MFVRNVNHKLHHNHIMYGIILLCTKTKKNQICIKKYALKTSGLLNYFYLLLLLLLLFLGVMQFTFKL